ncbi:hypothetical protein SAMN05216203_2631 [Marinobacter daqiaonensis]|uniref:Uncharacterized protein n=1 Tax=Marinobacter daqiaonensis TaxID=650891 RepID=A0A1I6J3W8_9GAMM|nr:hypothetical protein [Marinobacter daqiaonensis]SFR73712.1 hypothetical protein SAMN05216203_2631 [Marinobacter daqiaonensis]
MTGTKFNEETALQAAETLATVLAGRTHRRKVMGQEVLVPGQLGEALKLPQLINRLRSRHQRQRDMAVEDFQILWETLSDATRDQVIRRLGWYDPRELGWDDKRSNRRPPLPDT